jgi:hypothetical protein
LGSLFYKKEKSSKRGLISAANGMGEVVSKLEIYLRAQGVQFQYGQTENLDMNSLQHNTFLAIDFMSLNSVANFSVKNSLDTKKECPSSLSLTRITINFSSDVEQIDGFGILFPNKEAFHSLGVLANSKIFENRGDYNESWIFSESTLPDLMSVSDSLLIDRIRQDRRRVFSGPFEIKDYVVHRWPKVIPSYDSSLAKFLQENQELTNQLAGNYLGVLGLTGIHERNSEIADRYAKLHGKMK